MIGLERFRNLKHPEMDIVAGLERYCDIITFKPAKQNESFDDLGDEFSSGDWCGLPQCSGNGDTNLEGLDVALYKETDGVLKGAILNSPDPTEERSPSPDIPNHLHPPPSQLSTCDDQLTTQASDGPPVPEYRFRLVYRALRGLCTVPVIASGGTENNKRINAYVFPLDLEGTYMSLIFRLVWMTSTYWPLAPINFRILSIRIPRLILWLDLKVAVI